MSLDDPLFDGMFHGDGAPRRPGTCVCGQETSNEDEALCRMCLQDESQAAFQPESPVTSEQMHDADVRLVAAAASPHPRAVTTPTAMAVPLQTAAGAPSPHILVVTAPPLETFPSNSTVKGSGNRKKVLTETQAAKKKLTDRESQKRRIGKMRALQSGGVAHKDAIKSQEKKIRGLTASLQREVGVRSNANSTTRGGLHEHLLTTHYANWQSVKFALKQAYCKDTGSPRANHFYSGELIN